MPLAALAARLAAVWARCGSEGDAAAAARSSPLALLAGLEVRAAQLQPVLREGPAKTFVAAGVERLALRAAAAVPVALLARPRCYHQ